MNNGHTHVLLIEDNPGDADLVRLRLVEGDSAVSVSCVNRLDGWACVHHEATAFGGAAGPESSRQSWSGNVPQGARKGPGRARGNSLWPG